MHLRIPYVYLAGESLFWTSVWFLFLAHCRLSDGIFVRGEESKIFAPLREQLEQLQTLSNQTTRRPLNVFVMTDLPQEKWEGTYLHDINVNPNYTIHTMDEEEDLFIDVNQKIHLHEYGFVNGFLPQLRSLRWVGTSHLEDLENEIFGILNISICLY